jgi:soluble lytic murein transglycosylase-like protein
MTPEILEIVKAKAQEHHLDDKLLRALVLQESSGDQNAKRYEPDYKWLYFPEKCAHSLSISTDVETRNQKTSWGLMQVMGAVAREDGFCDHLEHLCLPEVGLEHGCILLKRLLSRDGYSVDDAVSAYNQGTRRKTPGGFYLNQKYVNEVFQKYRELA